MLESVSQNFTSRISNPESEVPIPNPKSVSRIQIRSSYPESEVRINKHHKHHHKPKFRILPRIHKHQTNCFFFLVVLKITYPSKAPASSREGSSAALHRSSPLRTTPLQHFEPVQPRTSSSLRTSLATSNHPDQTKLYNFELKADRI